MLMWETFSQVCINEAVVGAALTYIIKGIKGINKPAEDVKKQFKDVSGKLDNDNKRIKNLEDQSAFILKAISLLLQDDLAMLEHLRTNNSTGKMAEQEQKVQDFLIQRQ